MPYVKEEVRERYEHVEQNLVMAGVHTPGDFGYVLGILLNTYFASQIKITYATFAEAAGVLDTVWFDFKARFLTKYEAAKAEENGDVYTWHKEERN